MQCGQYCWSSHLSQITAEYEKLLKYAINSVIADSKIYFFFQKEQSKTKSWFLSLPCFYKDSCF